jgi:4-aminobutyrate aminotransferase/4-aminobutyrate aminotransferase/(S)-3-amino-2-methylpropionate transaminase
MALRDFVSYNIPGPESARLWGKEEELIAPGLQAVVQWARLCFAEASGAEMTDVDGNVYIDLMGGSGVNSIGHSHPRFLQRLRDRMGKVMIGGFTSAARVQMLELLREVLPAELDRIQLYSGGSEAVEASLRLAKSYTKGHEFVSFWGAYHGKTLGTLSLVPPVGRDLGPLAGGTIVAPYADCYRCPLGAEFPSCGFACVEFTRKTIKEQSVGSLAGIIIEPVQGRGGNVVPPDGYMTAMAEVATELDTLLIADETMTGFGRTGYMLASEHDGLVPDIAIVGKGMGAGYPVTAIISKTDAMNAPPFSDPSASSSSFGGFPLACEAVTATVSVIVDEGLAERSARLGAELLAKLKEALEPAPLVGDVRGRGLMIGIELVVDKETREPVSRETVRRVFGELLRHGVVVMLGRSNLRLYPPLNIDEDLAMESVERIAHVLVNVCRSP